MPAERRGPLCLRLSEDLHAAAHQMAEQEGVSSSEWIRNLIYRATYNEPCGIDEGYLRGRALGYQMVQRALRFLDIPPNADEAMQIMQSETSPGRTPHG